MKVLDITSWYSASAGGIKRYYREKARALPRRGVACHFAVPGATRADEPFGDGTLHTLPGPLMPGNASYRRFTRASGLAELIADLQPDVIELGSHYMLPLMVDRVVRHLRVRPAVVGFFHSHPEQVVQNVTLGLPLIRKPMSDLTWRLFRHRHAAYDATLIASGHMQSLASAWRIPRLHRVGFGVDVDAFKPAADRAQRLAARPTTVTYVGRFTVDKELDVLLEGYHRASELLRDAGAPPLHLRFLGDGPLRARLEGFAASREGVTVLPYLDRAEEIAGVIADSAAVVVPSQTETFSFSTAEALGCGVPVVGPRAGAVGEFLAESGAGFGFEAGRADALAQTLVEVSAASHERLLELGALGRAHILREFTWDAVAARVHAAYESALARRG